MARSAQTPAPDIGHVVDIDVSAEMQGSFLEYAYSVIYSRALPDACSDGASTRGAIGSRYFNCASSE